MSGFRNKKGKPSNNKGSYQKGSRFSNDGHRDEKYRTSAPPTEETNIEEEEEDGDDGDNEELDSETFVRQEMSVRVALWEFGQNDPKRDSGSKLCRLGYAQRLKIGQTFQGIVLSSEATSYLSPADAEIVAQYGVAGINCSWNRLDEIPFGTLGKGRHQRKLPLIFAANTVNYGKPFKMNTAEAIAAALHISGFVEDAKTLLYPFSYGQEFLRLNAEALAQYAKCHSEQDVQLVMARYMSGIEAQQRKKEQRKEVELQERIQKGNVGGYMDRMDLPPMDSDEDYEEEEEPEEAPKEAIINVTADSDDLASNMEKVVLDEGK